MNELRAGAAVGILVLGAASLVGCGSDDSAGEATHATATAGGSASAARDLSQGGTCRPGEAITIATPGASPVIDGECGSVSITADRVSGNIESATDVTVRGGDVSVLGTKWGTATVAGRGATINVDEIHTLVVTGERAKVTNRTLGTVTVDGAAATVNSNGIDMLTLNGGRATVVVSGPIAALAVHGRDNTVNWNGGVAAPSSGTGSSNTFVRTQNG